MRIARLAALPLYDPRLPRASLALTSTKLSVRHKPRGATVW